MSLRAQRASLMYTTQKFQFPQIQHPEKRLLTTPLVTALLVIRPPFEGVSLNVAER